MFTSYVTLIRSLLTGVCVMALSGYANAQGNGNYWGFNASSGSTLDSMTSATQIVNGAVNGTSTVREIGFSFSFGGSVYTQFSASSAGYLRLGATTGNVTDNDFWSTSMTSPVIAPFWDCSNSASVANTGGVKMLLSGAAPNRVLKVEWRLTAPTSTGVPTAGAANEVFQVWLYETSNQVRFSYGAMQNGHSASIGFTGADEATQLFSITPNATIASSTYSCFTANNAVNTGAVLANTTITFVPTPLTGTLAVGAAGTFKSVDNALGQLNWATTPAGATILNIDPAITETVRSGTTVPAVDIPAGYIISATGTSTNTITIQGNGGMPTLRPGTGIGNYDFVLGVAGGDHITINNLRITDNTANTTNATYAEMGIGLFKSRYNTTTGNDGCHAVKVTNCNIALNRKPNQTITATDGPSNYMLQAFYSRGIYANRYTFKHEGVDPGKSGSARASSSAGGGIRSQADVHRNCELSANTIDNCTIGIEFNDGYTKTGSGYTDAFAGTNNIIGRNGAGNTVTNFGADNSNIVYNIGGSGLRNYSRASIMAGILIAGQKDFTVEYNTVNGGISEFTQNSSLIVHFTGISVGFAPDGQPFPQYANSFFANIRHNSISNINVYNSAYGDMSYLKAAEGILFATHLFSELENANAGCKGTVNITNNTITNLKSMSGPARGITSEGPNYLWVWGDGLGNNTNLSSDFFSTGTINISHNTIKQLSQNSHPSYSTGGGIGPSGGIYWILQANTLKIDSNIIGGSGTDEIVANTTNYIDQNFIGLNGIYVNQLPTHPNFQATRSLLEVNGNVISNINRRVSGSITSQSSQRATTTTGIAIYNGAMINNVTNNSVGNMTVANGLNGSDYYRSIHGIRVWGKPRTGTSTVNITGNTVSNIVRTHFGHLSGMGLHSGIHSQFNGISADGYSTIQNRNISNNTITNLSAIATTVASNFDYCSRINGIFGRGKSAASDAITVNNNVISGISGDVWGQYNLRNYVESSNYLHTWNAVGINVGNYFTARIHDNKICNFTTNATSYPNNGNVHTVGIVGIVFGSEVNPTTPGMNKDGVYEAVYNNMISDLSAPSISAVLAVQGIYYWGYGKWGRIYHNTIVLGDPAGGPTGRITSTGNKFGVSGITLHNYYFNNRTYATDLSNNLISINATPKSSNNYASYPDNSYGGVATAWRHFPTSTPKKRLLGVTSTSGGNVYYMNNALGNYIYCTGANWDNNSDSRVGNAFGYWPSGAPANYVIPSFNIVNDANFAGGKFFNLQCGAYKSFWGATEAGSSLDLDVAGNWLTVPFVNSGSNCADKYKITTGATTIAASSKPIATPLAITTDAFGATRGTATVTAGAHEQGVAKPVPGVITINTAPLCDGICMSTKTLTATISVPAGYTIGSGVNAPRVYYRRIRNNSAYASTTSTTAAATTAIVDNNLIFGDHLNNAAGPSGWRWVNGTASGSTYTFNIDETKFSGGINTATYTVEYYVSAQAGNGSNTAVNWSGGDLSNSCPTSVVLNTANTGFSYVAGPGDMDGSISSTAVNYGTDAIQGNTVADNYTVFRAADVQKYMTFTNANTNYTTANATTAYAICTGEEVKLQPRFTVADREANQVPIDAPCVTYVLQRATNSAFTTSVAIVDHNADPAQLNDIPAVGTYYYRVGYSCDGGASLTTGMNSPYVSVTVADCPTNTTTPPANAVVCVNSTTNVTLSGTPVPLYYFIASPIGKVYTNTAATPSNAVVPVTPGSIKESGTWNTYVASQAAAALNNEGFPSTSLVTDPDNSNKISENTATDYGRGIALHIDKVVKLKSLKVADGADDAGSGSSGFTVSVYSKDGLTRLYQSGAVSVGDGATATVNFTNAWLAPGDYMLVADTSGANTNIVATNGGLVTVPGDFTDSIPMTNTPAVEITGGVEKYDITSLTDENNYFFDLNFDAYCTSKESKTFSWTINDAICCSVTAPQVGTIASGTQESGLQAAICRQQVDGWIYYYVSDSSANTGNRRKYLVGVHPNGNEWTPDNLTVYNNGAFTAAGGHIVSDGTDSTGVMPYMFKISNSANLTVNGGVRIRLFYNSAQKAAVKAMPGVVDSFWYKMSGDPADVLSALTPVGLTGASKLIPDSRGTENGIPYVQFDNMTSFSRSAFGYAGSTHAARVYVNAKVLLQGPMSGTTMTTGLSALNLVPLAQPYSSAPWNYAGANDVVTVIPNANVVDWVLVELRDSVRLATVVATRAAFVLRDGAIVDLDGSSAVGFEGIEPGRYHITVKHRNHMAVLSAVPVPLNGATPPVYDFTTSLSQASNPFGDPAQMVQRNGKWCMWLGDVDGDGFVDGTDYGKVYFDNILAPFEVYHPSDLDRDGYVDGTDLGLMYFNFVISPYTTLINY